jgi:hypothetical protein
MIEQNTIPVRWFGLNQDGRIVYLGTFATIDEADDTPTGSECTWLWREENLIELRWEITELLENRT